MSNDSAPESSETVELTASRVALDPDPYEEYNIVQAHKYDNRLYVSGQTAVDEEGELIGVDDFETQAEQVFANLETVLEAGGSTLDKVLKVNIYLTEMDYFDRIVELRAEYFTEPYPADTIVEVTSLALPEAMLEIEAIALVGGEIVNVT